MCDRAEQCAALPAVPAGTMVVLSVSLTQFTKQKHRAKYGINSLI